MGRRCPVSSRDNVLFDRPVSRATSVSVSSRFARSRRSRGPTWSSAAAIAVAPSGRVPAAPCAGSRFSFDVTTLLDREIPRIGNKRCRRLVGLQRFLP